MLTRLLLLAAPAAMLVSAQVPPQSVPIPGCTTDSFAIPSWFVQDLRYSASGNASFHLLNRASNYTADVACEVGGSDWTTCYIQGKPSSNDTLLASIQVGEDSTQVLVSQTWTCNDRNGTEPLKFIAVGNSLVAINCTAQAEDGQACEAVASPLLVKGSLLSPVAVTPVYAEGPPGHDSTGCMAAAENPSWILSLMYYQAQEGDGINTVSSRSFNLQIINPAIGYQAGCMSGGEPDDPVLVCAGQEFGELGTDRYHMATSATFDPDTLEFNVNQTWYCDDVDPAKPVSITGTGSMVLPLNCITEPVKDDPNGNKTICDTDEDVTVKGSLLFSDPLPPYSIEDPLPVPDGCTLSSILNPTWIFSAFQVDSNASAAAANDNSSAVVTFEIILQTQNPGFQFPVSITQGMQVGDDQWYECDIGGGGNTGQLLWPRNCTMQYTPATMEITLKSDWVCSDLDPDHPILFSGVTTTVVNSSLSCETVDDMSQCFTTDTSYSWAADITDVMWQPLP